MIMVEGTIGDWARPLWSFFVVLHWGGINSYIFGSGLGDTTIVCSFGFVNTHGLHACALQTKISASLTSTIHVLHGFGHHT